MRKFLQIFVLAAVLVYPSLAQKKLEITTLLDKDTFYLGEEVIFGLGLKNISGASIALNKYTLEVNLFDGKGNKIPRCIVAKGFNFELRNIVLNNGKEEYQVYNLNTIYGDNLFTGFSVMYYLSTGKYKLDIKLKDSVNNYVDEKELQYSIVEPKGDEAVFYSQLSSILLKRNRSNYDDDPAIEMLDKLHTSYPNSVYSPTVLIFLHNWIFLGKHTQKAENYIKELIDDYPWSRYAQPLIGYKISNNEKLQKQEKIDYLNKLLSKSGNGPVAKWIELSIKELSCK
jgi:hypothetical protein